jgi:riboflavin kinase/FMN adenylyltransferase
MPDLAPAPPGGFPAVVDGVDALERGHGPIFAVVGVFDGIHLGHRYLLQHLVTEAKSRKSRPTVITFDHHPDEVLVGAAPPLLVDPAERVRLLEQAGVEVVVVQHFDAALRLTEYDDFVHRITARTRLAGLLMTPEAAFGHERRGTPEALRVLGRRDGFDVVVVPAFTVDGRPVSSSEVRRLVTAGDLDGAARLLGRPYEVVGDRRGGDGRLLFPLPVALPPDGTYPVTADATGPTSARITGTALSLDRQPSRRGRVRVSFRSGVARVDPPPANM